MGTSSVDGSGADARPISRMEKRVLRTKADIQNAFVALVLEHGLENVSVEDIVAKADLAKATFYRHYDNKETLMAAVFARLVEEEAAGLALRQGPWNELRGGAVEGAYLHASELRDLYKVCLSDHRTRTAYLAIVARYAEDNFRSRLRGLNKEPRIPVPIMARAFAGAHVAILESWLDGEIPGSAEQMATTQLDLLVAGFAWAHNVSLFDLGYTVDPAPPGQSESPRKQANPRALRSQRPARTKGRPPAAKRP